MQTAKARFAISPCSGGLESARLLDAQFRMPQRHAPLAAPTWAQAKWQPGALELVETWDAKWDPFRDTLDMAGLAAVKARALDPAGAGREVDLVTLQRQAPVWGVVAQSDTSVTLVWPDPRAWAAPVHVEKTWSKLGADRPYGLKVDVTVWNLGATAARLQLVHEVSTFQDPAVSVSWIDSLAGPGDMKGASYRLGEDTVRHDMPALAEAEAEDRTGKGAPAWVGVGSRYFLLASAPLAGVESGADVGIEGLGNGVVRGRVSLPAVSVEGAPSGCIPAWHADAATRPGCDAKERRHRTVLSYDVYGGPKAAEQLEPAGHHLVDAIDLGWFGAIAMPMTGVLKWAHGWSGNWPFAIFLLTLIVRVLLWPLTGKSLQSMRKMQTLKPEMDRLRAEFEARQTKFGKDKVDPQELNRATFDLYKKHGVNPFGGCLPMLLQMPIYIALYRTILSSVDLFNQPLFGWIGDLTQKDPYYVLPVLLGGVMFVQQKLTPQPGQDPAQQKMMLYFMPALFTFMMLALPSGLTLYILVNTLLGILQTFLVNRAMPVNTGAPAASPRQSETK
ncbi:MAG: membrane protein insertase YidC [Myxococcales bacterium]|nr:membrane protein insertase YidC [Myxococcales bacterium]